MTAMHYAMKRALREDMERRIAISRDQRDQLARLLSDGLPCDPCREAKERARLRQVEIDLAHLQQALEAVDHV